MTRPNKYHAQRCEHGDHSHDSRRERDRCWVLEQQQAAGAITGLERQVRYRLAVNGHRICDYVADFRYTRDGVVIVEDTKGVRTPVYRLKAALMAALHGVTILET